MYSKSVPPSLNCSYMYNYAALSLMDESLTYEYQSKFKVPMVDYLKFIIGIATALI